MAMLGHQALPTQQGLAEAVQPEVNEEIQQIAALEAEIGVADLTSPDTDMARRMEIVSGIRSRLESLLVRSLPTVTLLRATLNSLAQSLTAVPANLNTSIDSHENKFRRAVVELLGRVPLPDVPRQRVPTLVDVCHRVLETDHEENGVVAQRLLFEIHKAYKQSLDDHTPQFFEWLRGLFEALPSAIEKQLAMAATDGADRAAQPLIAARESPKIATDVALMVFFLMQSYPRRVTQYGPALVPLMVANVAFAGPERDDVPPAAVAVYTDFRMAQIKTMAFMIVVSRSQHMAQLLEPHCDTMCDALLRLLRTVPDVVSTRKEVLTCMRNMMGTPFRAGLQRKMDDLLDEKTLLGTDRVCIEALRQVAYINLAELIAHAKAELSMEQLQRVVWVYTRNALDAMNPPNLQTTSLRLLYNVIEVLFNKRGTDPNSSAAYRDLLSDILKCYVDKLGALKLQTPRHVCELRDLEEARRQRKETESHVAVDASKAAKMALASYRRKTEEQAKVVKKQREAEAAALAQVKTEPEAMTIEGQAPGSGEGAIYTAIKIEETPAGTPGSEAILPAKDASLVGPLSGDGQPQAIGPGGAQEEGVGGEHATAQDAAEVADQDKEERPPPPPFRVLLQPTVGISAKEREILEFRTLLHTVLNCLKSILAISVAYHTTRGIQSGVLSFTIKPWSSRPDDVRAVSNILTHGLPAISFFEHAVTPPNFDAREVLADLFTALADGRDFSEIFAPQMSLIYELILSNGWYSKFLRHLIEGDGASKTFVNRHALACLMRFLVNEKLDKLDDRESAEGKLTLELLELCFDAMPRIQTADVSKAATLQQHGLPTVERAVLPYVVGFLKKSYPRLAAGGTSAIGHTQAMRSLFVALASTNKFTEIQAAVGTTGLHARIVDTALAAMQGPSVRAREAEEAAAELCLLVPARLEHLIPLMPRMMHATVRALGGSDRSVHIALRVLDQWVESFNPEFIERCMTAVIKPLMAALWSHIRPPPHPFGAKVAEMLGKMGGRGRRWLGESTSVDFKPIPEYGLRVILAFPPHTSFLVPLDRCVQLAWATVESGSADAHRRKNALRLLQICVSTLSRQHLPDDMVKIADPAASAMAERQKNGEASATHLSDDALGRLQALLFGNAPTPEIPADMKWPSELGVKTKKQHAAERQMLETVLTAMMASVAVADELEGSNAKEFAHATCRHFALLLASGWAATAMPPPAPPSSRVEKYSVRGGIPAYVATLKHLQPHVLLDAFQQGLKQSSAAARDAVVECMGVFLDTLVEVGEVQGRERARAPEDAPAAETAAGGPSETTISDANAFIYLNVQQDLIMRAMHTCYGDTWASRLGGVAAVKALVPRMPQKWLGRFSAFVLKAVIAVLRSLPENAAQEEEEIAGVFLDVVRRTLALPADGDHEGAQGGAVSEAPMTEGDQTRMEIEPEEEEVAQTGKRGKRGGPQPPRKRHQRQAGTSGGEDTAYTSPAAEEASVAAEGAEPEDELATDVRRLLHHLLEALVSSKNNDAVRAVAAKGVDLVAQSSRKGTGALVYSVLAQDPSTNRRDGQPSSRLEMLLERRMLPLRSVVAQTNYASCAALLLRTCPQHLELTPSSGSFIADCCTLMELEDSAIASSVVIRGQPVKPDVIVKLQVACMDVLVAAVNWPAFQKATDVNITNHHWGSMGESTITVQQLRDRLLRIFIRRLGALNDKVIALSSEGLTATMSNNLVEKQVLHDALRPILMDLAVYQRMTVPLLRHLHRLVDLLSGQFNVTFGQRLTEHLQKWMEPEKYLYGQPQQPVSWEPGTEWEVAASMLDIFHKFPSAAKEFLETHDGRPGIVVLTIGLEEALCHLSGQILPSKMSSPYRAPLTRFLNRYSDESIVYFLGSTSSTNRLAKPEYFNLLLDIIRTPLARPLLEALKGAVHMFIRILKTEVDDEALKDPRVQIADSLMEQSNCIRLLATMSELSPDWLPQELADILVKRWKLLTKKHREGNDDAKNQASKEGEYLARLLVNYVRRRQDEIETLFDLIAAFTLPTATDFSFLKVYLSTEVAQEFSVEGKRAILVKWMENFEPGDNCIEDRVNCMRHLINPMVTWAVRHQQEDIFTTDVTESFVSVVFRSISSGGKEVEQLKAESIQLCGVLLQYAHGIFKDREKKEIIQYVWGTLKQDNIAKPYAFLCVAHFFNVFRGWQDNVPKLKAFVNMVRIAPTDASSREAVRQAIDIIVPLLAESPDEVPMTTSDASEAISEVTSLSSFPGDVPTVSNGGSGRKRPSYAAHLKKVVMEEGVGSPTLLIILQMVVRNRELFYSTRSTFIPLMVNNLTRMGLYNQAPLESRVLAVDMAATLYWWDMKAAEEEMQSKVGDDSMELDNSKVQAAEDDSVEKGGSGKNARLTAVMNESIMNFLCRMAFVSSEVRDRDEAGWRKLHAHCLDVLRDAARHRPPSPLKFGFFDKFLQQSIQQQQAQQSGHPADASAHLVTGLRVVNILLEFQPENVVSCCDHQIQMMIEPAIYSKHRAPAELLGVTARSLYSAFPPSCVALLGESEAAVAAMKTQTRIGEVLTKYLNHIAEPPNFNPESFWYACNCVSVMGPAVQATSDSMQDIMFSLLKAMNRVAKDHNQQPQAALLACKGAPKESPTDADYSSGPWFMFHALNIAVPSALVLSAEHRKLFLSTLVMLITGQSVRQGQTDPSILFTIMNLMRGWLLAPKTVHLTHKELLVLLQRLAQVERLHAIPVPLKQSWDSQFLDLLYTVITTKKEEGFGDDVFLRVERTFCCGLQSNDPDTRKKFFRLYSDRIQRDLFDRLRYIIQYQDWDFVSHTFWLKHAVALLFDCLQMRDPITLAFNSAHVPPLFNYKDSLVFPGTHAGHAVPGQQQSARATGETIGTSGPKSAQGAPSGQEDVAMKTEGQDAHLGDFQGPGPSNAATEGQGTNVPGETNPATARPSAAPPSSSAGNADVGGNPVQKPAVLYVDLPESLRSMLDSHLEFLRMHTGMRSESLVSCLIEQVQTDPLVAHHLWVLLFPIVWTSLQKEQQTGLAKPIIQLLSKEHHLRQAYLRPTVGQTLLDGISMSQPQPKIPAEMIKYMGRHFHAWHTAVSMLESHVGLFPGDMRCFDAVCSLYAALGEEDMRCGVWQRRAGAEETRTALALQTHGFVPDAQALYLEMMSRGVSPEGVSGVSKDEMVLWHNQYLSCCMELNQWDTVAEYAKSTENSVLQLEAAAKLHDWVHLKQMAVPKAQVEEGPDFSMIKAQLQLSEMSLIEVDKLCKTALNQCVIRWWQMPESSPWSYAPVLHSFQRVVELLESWRVMMEFSMQGGQGAQYQDLKDIAETWKLRTPNEWEPVRWWSDILTWRNQVYNMTIRQFSSMQATVPNLHQMGYRDKAWSVNRLAHVARLHHLPETCVQMINTLYGFNAMEVQEAFVKVQEQAKAYMLRRSEHLHGLNLINSTNMDYFQSAHQAEMICLKAQFLHLLNEPEPANSAFSEALTLWSLCPDAWINWGRYCDDRYITSKHETAQKQQKLQPVDATWLEFAATCYTQGIRLSGTEARNLVPRLLQLLMLDMNGPVAVGRALMSQAGDLPTWVWLPWLSQLLTSLQRDEYVVARRILVAAAAQHPQYVFWHIRPAMALLRDQAQKAVTGDRAKREQQPKAAQGDNPPNSAAKTGTVGDEGHPSQGGVTEKAAEQGSKEPPKGIKAEDTEMAEPEAPAGASDQTAAASTPALAPSTQTESGAPGTAGRPTSPFVEKPIEYIAFEGCKEVLEMLKAKQALAVQSLDILATELGQRFGPRTDERLLSVVYTLQQRVYRAKDPLTSPIPEVLRKEVSSVCRACSTREINTAAAAATASSGGAPFKWVRYQHEFARDLDPESENAPKTLGELGERLKGWRTLMETMIEDMHPPVMKLEELSERLVEMALEELEMPCQAPPCPDGPDPVYIEKIGADVEVVRRGGASSRRISVIGNDGQTRSFVVQLASQHMTAPHIEERLGQLFRAANGVMAAHPESRRRGLAFVAPRSVTLFPAGRLMEDDPSGTLYLDAYETYCARYGKEPDAPILHFNAAICQQEGGDPADPGPRRAAYDEILKEMVTENVFSQYMYKTMVENSRVMWAFKRQFALSVALSAVACYTLRLTGRTPSRLLVSKARGEITHLELATAYNDRLQLDNANETVPFRLTRNMVAFIGPHGFEGILIAAAVAAAQGLQQERTPLPSMLALFLRDDMLAFVQKRLNLRSIAAVAPRLNLQTIETAIVYNVTHCMHRLETMGPKSSVTPPTGANGAVANPQAGMRELASVAVNPNELCQMDALWQPWL